MRFAGRMSRLGTETAFEVLARARRLEEEGREIIHLELGEPDFNTPGHIVEAAVESLRGGDHHYSPSPGIPELRRAIAEHVSEGRGISVDPEEVVVTPGAKPILFFSLLALAEEGSEVVYPDPGFPIYESMIRFAGARPVPVRLREELDFRMDVGELVEAVNTRTRLIILNSPNNPTGSVLSRGDLARLAGEVASRDVTVLSDEIYSRILYGEEHVSIASFPGMKERTILLDGFSKTYAMTGWRLGYGVMPRELAEKITRLVINANSCTAVFVQKAGVAALRGDDSAVRKMVATFRERRDRLVRLLGEIDGVTCRVPRGAFYVFPGVKALGLTSSEVARRLLEEAGVALLSGTAFGIQGEGYLRISYAASLETLEEGVGRIREFVSRL